MKTILTRTSARSIAHRRANAAGLDPKACDTVAHGAMSIFHPEFTTREWINFVDQEIEKAKEMK